MLTFLKRERSPHHALTSPCAQPPACYAAIVASNATLAKVWPLGLGYVIYLGAGTVPEDVIFAKNSSWPDRDVYRQLLRNIALISKA